METFVKTITIFGPIYIFFGRQIFASVKPSLLWCGIQKKTYKSGKSKKSLRKKKINIWKSFWENFTIGHKDIGKDLSRSNCEQTFLRNTPKSSWFDKSSSKSTCPRQNMFHGQNSMSPIPTRFTKPTPFFYHYTTVDVDVDVDAKLSSTLYTLSTWPPASNKPSIWPRKTIRENLSSWSFQKAAKCCRLTLGKNLM